MLNYEKGIAKLASENTFLLNQKDDAVENS
jgi:hypothetical protein